MRLIPTLSVTLSFLILTAGKCKKDKEEAQLPPETTIGAMTFGCKVNGKVFVPRDGNGRPGLYVQYVYLGNGPGGGWFLNIPAIDWKSSPIPGVSIETDSLLLVEGVTYPFKNIKGNPRAFYNKDDTYIALDNDGSLKITKFDQINRILSGTFSFVGTSSNAVKVNITEGRFDIRY
jgi:hypothetical protein